LPPSCFITVPSADKKNPGSQIPLYFIGASLSFVTADIGGTDKAAWLPVANTLALGATAPFVGYMQDLIGRRYIALLGCLLLIVGVVIFGTAHEFGQAVTGMAISGMGGGIGE
jgi:MFS family permease